MPEPTITAPAEAYDFLASAQKAHEGSGYDFPTAFDNFWNRFYVFKTPQFMLMGAPDLEREDAWLIWWAELHPSLAGARDSMKMVELFYRCMPYPKPYIGWARTLKGRRTVKYYSTERLGKFTQK